MNSIKDKIKTWLELADGKERQIVREDGTRATRVSWLRDELAPALREAAYQCHVYYDDACVFYADAHKAEDRVKELEAILKDFRDNWDCDEDSHKYNTPCRCCEAAKALEGKK